MRHLRLLFFGTFYFSAIMAVPQLLGRLVALFFPTDPAYPYKWGDYHVMGMLTFFIVGIAYGLGYLANREREKRA